MIKRASLILASAIALCGCEQALLYTVAAPVAVVVSPAMKAAEKRENAREELARQGIAVLRPDGSAVVGPRDAKTVIELTEKTVICRLQYSTNWIEKQRDVAGATVQTKVTCNQGLAGPALLDPVAFSWGIKPAPANASLEHLWSKKIYGKPVINCEALPRSYFDFTGSLSQPDILECKDLREGVRVENPTSIYVIEKLSDNEMQMTFWIEG